MIYFDNISTIGNTNEYTTKHVQTVSVQRDNVSTLPSQCSIKGGARGAAAPGPAVLGGPQLVGLKNFYVLMCCI